jgi:GNAT superfamily N-acetyltransferase
MTPITVTSMREEHLPAVVACLVAQGLRLAALDPRLRAARSPHQVEAALTEHYVQETADLVALDAIGRVRGYTLAGVWELSEQSSLHAFLSPKNGVARLLALPDPAGPDAPAVAEALLVMLSQVWHDQRTTGDLIRWPVADRWLLPLLCAQGFQLDSVCALRALSPLRRPNDAPGLRIRPAQPAEEERLVALFEEELRAHEPYTPFVQRCPAARSAFRRKLARLFAGERFQDGAPLVPVAERDGESVAMIQSTLVEITSDEEPGFTPPGLYGRIDNLSVGESWRGQGIGRALVQVAFDAFAATGLPLSGWLLWYNPENPLAAAFWPRLDFVPLWSTYQRRHPEVRDGEH